MSAENVLKKQTKVILGKNNWMKSVTGFLCVLTSLAIPFMLIYFSAAFLDDSFLKNNTVDFSVKVLKKAKEQLKKYSVKINLIYVLPLYCHWREYIQ